MNQIILAKIILSITAMFIVSFIVLEPSQEDSYMKQFVLLWGCILLFAIPIIAIIWATTVLTK